MRDFVVHIAREGEWRRSLRSGEYAPAEFERDGFIHLSTPEQVHLPANALFSGESGLVLLWIDPTRLRAELRYEPPETRAPLFPHLYGSLNVDAVVAETALETWKQGEFVLPPRPA